jgi:hypothetical protein
MCSTRTASMSASMLARAKLPGMPPRAVPFSRQLAGSVVPAAMQPKLPLVPTATLAL